MRARLLSLSLWCAVCVTVVCACLPMLLMEQESRFDADREPFVALALHWHIAFSPEPPAAADWRPLDPGQRELLKSHAGTVWFQRSLPELPWRSPYLVFLRMNAFEAYLDGEKLYAFNMDNSRRYVNELKMMHAVPVNPGDAGRTLLIRAEWDNYTLFGNDMVLAGDPDQILYATVHAELAYLVYAFLGLATAIVGLALFLRRREAMYGWFTLFCASMGGAFLFSCSSLQWMFPLEAMYYWQELLQPAAVWAGIGFYANVLGIARKPLLRYTHVALALYMLVSAAVAIWRPRLYSMAAAEADTALVFAAFALITYALARYRISGEEQDGGEQSLSGQRQVRKWLMRGYYTLILCAMASLGAYLFPAMLNFLLMEHAYVYRVIEGMLANGLLLFIVCMVMAMASRVRAVHRAAELNAAELQVKNRQLEQFHRNLEQLVETRTSELEQANRNLALTLREKAESLAEISVLEERNRIAYEMHDVVGHTLTAAIVQIEATKRLAERQSELALDKLDLLSELVRKGLDDIRQAVRMMKVEDDAPELSLEQSLCELIQYTEDTMEVAVETDIILPNGLELGRLTERVLYHALQEGLTNAIRHGHCKRAAFSLHADGRELRFRLVSDGQPFGAALPGFGLSSMIERIRLLGGDVGISSSDDGAGGPCGCELTITLPLG